MPVDLVPSAVAARYGSSAPADLVTNDVIELQLAHRSVRRYLPDEVTPAELKAAGLTPKCLVRINMQGDIEVRRPESWDVIGGLIGDYEKRIKHASGRDWAS